jgi:hypothetical protein
MSLKTHTYILKGFWDKSKFFAILLVVFAALSILMNFLMTDPRVSLFGLIVNIAIIGLLYGWMVTKSTNRAKLIYEHVSKNDTDILGETGYQLALGITAKDTFWTIAIMLPIFGIINHYIPAYRILSYTLFDLAFFVSMVYGLQSAYLLDSYTANVGADLLKTVLGENNETNNNK